MTVEVIGLAGVVKSVHTVPVENVRPHHDDLKINGSLDINGEGGVL